MNCNLLKVNNAYLGPCCWFDDDDRECRRLRDPGRWMDDRSACSVGEYICCCYLDEWMNDYDMMMKELCGVGGGIGIGSRCRWPTVMTRWYCYCIYGERDVCRKVMRLVDRRSCRVRVMMSARLFRKMSTLWVVWSWLFAQRGKFVAGRNKTMIWWDASWTVYISTSRIANV